MIKRANQKSLKLKPDSKYRLNNRHHLQKKRPAKVKKVINHKIEIKKGMGN